MISVGAAMLAQARHAASGSRGRTVVGERRGAVVAPGPAAAVAGVMISALLRGWAAQPPDQGVPA
jgi:hypothetical protein